MTDLLIALSTLLDEPEIRERFARLERLDTLCGAPGPQPVRGANMVDAAREANACAEQSGEWVSATLYAFGQRPGLFPKASRAMTYLLVMECAQAEGVSITLEDDAFETLLQKLSHRQLRYDDVLRWVDDRIAVSPSGAAPADRSPLPSASDRASFAKPLAPQRAL